MNKCKMIFHRQSLFGSVLFGLTGLAGCGNQEELDQVLPPRPAKVIEVGEENPQKTLVLPGIVESRASAALTFEVSGTLNNLEVKEGQHVNKGDVIAVLDQRGFKNEVATVRAEFEQAQSAFERSKRLLEGKAIAQGEFEQRKAARNVAKANLDSALKRLDDATLKAPFSGIVATVSPKQFEAVGPQDAIATIQALEGAQISVQVPSAIVAASGSFDVEETKVFLEAAPEKPIVAELYSSAVEANPKTQTYLVKYSFTPPEGLVVLPGMSGGIESRVRMSEGEKSRAKVPVHAVMSDGDESYVWVVEQETMTVTRTNVDLAPGAGDALVVNSGLTPGDWIVGAGASYLSEGARIARFEEKRAK